MLSREGPQTDARAHDHDLANRRNLIRRATRRIMLNHGKRPSGVRLSGHEQVAGCRCALLVQIAMAAADEWLFEKPPGERSDCQSRQQRQQSHGGLSESVQPRIRMEEDPVREVIKSDMKQVNAIRDTTEPAQRPKP